jgi:TatD family-associated radical SAM protein
VKAQGKRVRVNTNGQGNLIHKRNIVPELAGLVDVMSISLNAENREAYNKVCLPDDPERAYDAVLDFARACVGVIPSVVLTVLDQKCRAIAEETGAELRVRTMTGTMKTN